MLNDLTLLSVLRLAAKASFLIPAVLAPYLYGIAAGWPMGRFSLWEFAGVIFTRTGQEWYMPALTVFLTLAIFTVLAVGWYSALRAIAAALDKLIQQKPSL